MHWKAKAALQWGFARLPYGERLNHLAQIARGSFTPGAQLQELLIQLAYLRKLNERFPLAGKTVVEIGPGWQGLGVLCLYLFGCERIIAIDQERHIRWSLISRLMNVCKSNWRKVCAVGGALRPLREFDSLEHTFNEMCVEYMAPGDAADTGMAPRSVDLVYSYGVLEHISPESLERICAETARILKPAGRASHNIGLHDHFHNAGLGNGVNFLRYSARRWKFLCGNRITYHNRMRFPSYLEMFARHNLKPVWSERELLDVNVDTLKRMSIHPDFAHFTHEELATSHLFVDLIAESAAS